MNAILPAGRLPDPGDQLVDVKRRGTSRFRAWLSFADLAIRRLNSTVAAMGGVASPVTVYVTSSDSPYTLPAYGFVVALCNAHGGAITLDPPAVPGNPQIIAMKDVTGESATHHITFSGTVGTNEESVLKRAGQWLWFAWNETDSIWSQIG